jgi:polysaccharide export outer membrane protein
MWGARLVLAAGAALALAGCMHERTVQQADARSTMPSAPAGYLYSASPAFAQQAYEQPIRRATHAQITPSDDRGLFSSKPRERVPVTGPSAVGGPYIAAPNAYASAPPSGPVVVVADRPYTLDAGDRLRVVVFGQDGITNTYIVDSGGKVNLPLIGAVSARGLTNQQLAAAITSRLKQGYVREPHVSVEVETYRPFFILGEVTTPGQYPYVANLTAEMAVAIAGGFAPRAYKKTVQLTRRAGGQQGPTELPLDYPVRPGDSILVKERWF